MATSEALRRYHFQFRNYTSDEMMEVIKIWDAATLSISTSFCFLEERGGKAMQPSMA
jgi:hypothetical protein